MSTMNVPTKVAERISAALKRFQPILESARARDVNESDTSMIVSDMLADLFGYDKYTEVTREMCIRGTYCDLATKVDGQVRMIIEVKAIGLDLRDQHVKQAVDYAANQGVEWVVLTNGIIWRVFKVTFAKPIEATLVLDLDISAMSARNATDIGNLYLLTRESVVKSALDTYHGQKEATSKFYLAALILSDTVLEAVRRELRRLSDVKVDVEDLRTAISSEVLKREVIDGEKADHAKRRVRASSGKLLRTRREETEAGDSEVAGSAPEAKAPATPE